MFNKKDEFPKLSVAKLFQRAPATSSKEVETLKEEIKILDTRTREILKILHQKKIYPEVKTNQKKSVCPYCGRRIPL